jgi:hypothetical protein
MPIPDAAECCPSTKSDVEVTHMRNPKPKRPNATKHGVFSAITILPGEDAIEFRRLLLALIVEWNPVGPTEDNTVLSIAEAMWRKERIQKFIQVRLYDDKSNPHHPSYDEAWTLQSLAFGMKVDPERAFKEMRPAALRADTAYYLEEKFPSENYASTSEWAQAVIDEINTVLIPARSLDKLGPEVDVQTIEAQAAFMQSAQSLWGDLLEKEIALIERQEAIIDRLTKRLIQIKAAKQMLAQTASLRASREQSKLLTEQTAH